MRGRRPKPTELKVIDGNPGKRRLPKQSAADGIEPEPPVELDDLARAEWDYIVPLLKAAGVLSSLDRAALAVYCAAFGRWRRAELLIKAAAEQSPHQGGLLTKAGTGAIKPHPLVAISAAAARDVVRLAAEFGLSPVARSRLRLDPNKPPGGKFTGMIGGLPGDRA